MRVIVNDIYFMIGDAGIIKTNQNRSQGRSQKPTDGPASKALLLSRSTAITSFLYNYL